MAYNLSAFAGAGAQFFDNNGDILSGGLLYVYTAGTTTPVTTWTSNSGAVANTNPIVLDSTGRTPNEIWLNSGVTYKFVLKTSTGTLLGTYDNIPAIDDPTVFNNLITVTGTDTLIGTSTPPYTTYVTGMTLSFVAANTNTGAVTIDVDGLGAKNIYSGGTDPLGGGEIVAGNIVQIEYDGVRFQLYKSIIAASSISTSMLADGAVIESKLANSSVSQSKLQTNSVTTAKINAAAVTSAKLSGAQTGDAPVYGVRAWLNMDGDYLGTGPTIRASGNVLALHDYGVGIYGVIIDVLLSTSTYSVVVSAEQSVSLGSTHYPAFSSGSEVNKDTGGFRVYCFNSSAVAADCTSVNLVVIE